MTEHGTDDSPSAVFRTDNAPPNGRHPRSIPVPRLAEKLAFLLARIGKRQKWLAQQLNLVPRPALGPVEQSHIANWKRAGTVPEDVFGLFCRLLGVPEAVMREPDYDRFVAGVERVSALGSGFHWHRLIGDATADDLQILIDNGASHRPLGNLSFSRPPHGPPRRKPDPQVTLDQRIRIAIPVTAIRFPADDATLTFSVEGFVLACKDPAGWKVLCPNAHRTGFERTEDAWVLPSPRREGFHLEEPTGSWRAVAVVLSKAPPGYIDAALRDPGPAGWACDALAAWLIAEAVPHMVLCRNFHVLPAAGR